MNTKISTALLVMITLCCACTNDPRYRVVENVRRAAKLATTETIVDKIVFGTSDKKLLGIIRLNEARFAAYSTAIITTGIDLDKLRPADIEIHCKRIELKLPPVEVLNFSYPFSKFRIDDAVTANAFLNRIDISDQENFYRLAETEIRNNLPYYGIAEATQQRTRQLLYGILTHAGFSEIYITFRPGTLEPDGDEAGDSVAKPSTKNHQTHEH